MSGNDILLIISSILNLFLGALVFYHNRKSAVNLVFLLFTVGVAGWGLSVVMLNNFQDLPSFLGQLTEKQCTMLSAVPYNAHVLLKWGNLSRHDLSSLKAITFSGNKLPPPTIEHLTEALPGA